MNVTPLTLNPLNAFAYGPRSKEALATWTGTVASRAAENTCFFGEGKLRLRQVPCPTLGLSGLFLGEMYAEPNSLTNVARLRVGPFALPTGVDWALAHGWQCWSESPFLTRHDVLACDVRRERWVFGDPAFYPYEERPGVFHSWSWSWCGASAHPGAHGFLGADGGRRIAVAFVFDLQAGCVWVDCDVEGLELPGNDAALLCRFVLPAQLSAEAALCDQLRAWSGGLRGEEFAPGGPGATVGVAPNAVTLPVRGYTSWYHHYKDIDLALLERNLAAAPGDMQVFQIDDGYQKSIGEWTQLRPGFGTDAAMHDFIRCVRDRGMVPGLWLAPFVVAEGSALLARHPEWVLRDGEGQPLRAGHIPHWGGNFYAIDLERDDVRTWLDGILAYWTGVGVGFFKCDFLYAPSVAVVRRGPIAGRQSPGTLTRLERARRAHDYLYNRIRHHGALFLSCGALMDQALGSCDFSRVGADVGQTWDDTDASMRWSREKVSTRAALGATLARAALSGCGLFTDGDVSIVRSTETSLSASERELLAWVNSWASDVQFVSCDMFAWDEGAGALYDLLARRLRSLAELFVPQPDARIEVVGVWPTDVAPRGEARDATAAAELEYGRRDRLGVRLRVRSADGHTRTHDLNIDLGLGGRWPQRRD